MAETLLLTRSQVEGLLDPAALLESLRPAFAAYSRNPALRAHRFPFALPAAPPGSGGMLIAPGLMEDVPAYTVKVHSRFPDHPPAIRGLLMLVDVRTGQPLAVLDSTYLTAARTAAASVLGADVLARPGACEVALIGAGVQAAMHVALLRRVRPVRRVRVYDALPGRAEAFCRAHADAGVPLASCATLGGAVAGADWIVTATWASAPFLYPGMVMPGAHVTTLGADGPGKRELSAELLREARLFCDDRALCLAMGAAAGAGLGADAIAGELGEAIAGTRPGRAAPDEITVFASVGLACQDLAAAWLVYRRALERKVGTMIDWLG